MKTEPSIRHDVTLFGYVIACSDGRVSTRFRDDKNSIERELELVNEFFTETAPHRIVELYTKEQMERKPLNSDAIRKIFQMNWNPPHPIDWGKLVRDIEAAHGIVESSSDEKGDL